MKNKIGLILLGLLAAALLAFLLKDIINSAILTPAVYLFRALRIVYGLIPQAAYWGLLLLALLPIALKSISIGKKRRKDPLPEWNESPGRVQAWSRWIEHSAKGNYFKWQLAKQFSELTLNLLANQEQLTPQQAREHLLSGKLDIPLEIEAYLLAGLDSRSYLVPGESRFAFLRKPEPTPLDLPPEKMVAFLESRAKEG